jgi:spore coat protein CotH
MRPLIRAGVVLFVVAFGVQPLAAQTADDFFNPGVLHRLELWMNQADWAKLKAAFQENTYYPADVVWNGITIRNAGIRSRGLGSRSSTKPGLRVDVNRYAESQAFLGLKSFILDNLTQDPSGIRENIANQLLTRIGVPAAREAHTRLYVNGEYAGLYGIIESVDKSLMGRLFDGADNGFLFEYKYQLGSPWRFEDLGRSLDPYKLRFGIKTNENKSDATIWGPIEELVRLVNTTPIETFEAVVGPRLDLAAFTRFLAAQNFIAENDGFVGYAGMNNFYFYRRQDSSSHVFIAWDDDVAFLQSDFGITTRLEDNTLSRKVLMLPRYQAMYTDVLVAAAAASEGWMRGEIERLLDMIGEAMESDTNKPYSNQQHADERRHMLAFPDQRITYVRCEVAKQTGATRPPGCQ